MKAEKKKEFTRWRRRRHIRKKLEGTSERPRLSVFKSLKNIYCQIIDDTVVDKQGNRSGKTLVSCSSLALGDKVANGGNKAAAIIVGTEIAKLAQEKNITKIVFDRGGYKYHGRIQALADAARKAGLEF